MHPLYKARTARLRRNGRHWNGWAALQALACALGLAGGAPAEAFDRIERAAAPSLRDTCSPCAGTVAPRGASTLLQAGTLRADAVGVSPELRAAAHPSAPSTSTVIAIDWRLAASFAVLAGALPLATGIATRRRMKRWVRRVAEQQHASTALACEAAREAERQRIARELHDEIGQSFTAILVSAAFITRHAGRADATALRACASDIAEQAQAAAMQVRHLLSRLSPPEVDGPRLQPAVQALVDGWQRRGDGVALRASLPATLPSLAAPQAQALYRSLQEALTNAWRHSGARHIDVQLAASPERGQRSSQVVLRVVDDGGARADQVKLRAGRGLKGMAERVALAGGTAQVVDGPHGVCIEVRVPVEAAGDAPAFTTAFALKEAA